MQNTKDSTTNNNFLSCFNLFDSLSFYVLVTDQNLQAVYSNRSFNGYFNLPFSKLILHKIFENDVFDSLKKMSDLVFTQDVVSENDIVYKTEQNLKKVLNVRLETIKNNDQRYLIFIFKDVSEKRENIQLKAYQDSLDKMNLELDQFLYKTAHDLRAPLANLIGLISIMRNESDLELLSSYFDLQEKSVNKMDDFIQKITVYTKNTRLPISVRKIDFKLLIDSVLNELMYYDRSEFVNKSVHIEDNIKFYSDRERLEIILKNILANSIKFSRVKDVISKLDLTISMDGEHCKIVLKDNGIGIPKNIQHKVFDMFYRGHASADGSGIGLYIVKETIMKLGGSIALKSEENVYTEITLILPSLKYK